jgi:hypothetical protein
VGTKSSSLGLDAVLELLELQALTDRHAIHINFQRVYFQIYLLLLQHLRVEQVTKCCFRLEKRAKGEDQAVN